MSEPKVRREAPKKPRKAAEPVSPRVARRERRRERSREEIVAAARAVLLRDGLPATTLDAVAREVGLTKAALYYYFPSKEALFFEVLHEAITARARAVNDAVEAAPDAAGALRAMVRETIAGYAPHLDEFRLVYLQAQVHGDVKVLPEQLERIRPLNHLTYGALTRKIAAGKKGRAGVEPRLLAFLAHMSAIGVLTMKGMVESADDPLLHTDEQLIDALARIFAAAAAP